MAGRKKENFDRARVEFKAEPEWIERVTREGERLGLNLSAFIRMVVTQYVDRVEAERALTARPKDRK
jgi:predicted DNA-binding ribbon-helix-helix protein